MGTLARFGVSLEEDLLFAFDALCEQKGYANRSEALRDLIRRALIEAAWEKAGGVGAGTLTLVYDHHKGDIGKRLTQMQHDAHHLIGATLHIHLDHDNCLEVLVLKGDIDAVRGLAHRLISCRGVKHGSFTLTTAEQEV